MEDLERKRHCWQRRRNCVVCDSTEPACRRCSAAGVKVLSRNRRTENAHPTGKSTTIVTAPAQAFQPRRVDWNIPYNACILEDLTPMHEVGRHPYIHHISPARLKEATSVPEFLRSGLICMTLNHRMNQLGIGSSLGVTGLAERYYLHWGITIRSLNKQLNVENKRTNDMVIAGILTILLADIQNGAQVSWHHHLDGIHKLVSLRGGFRALAPSQSLAPLLHCLWFISIITNTTSKVSQINYLYLQVKIKNSFAKKYLLRDAYNILEKDWIRIGTVYKSATALYSILSLQSMSVLSANAVLRATCFTHGQVLLRHLPEGLSSGRTKRFMLWPLVLLGVEAVHSGMATRAFVSKQLPELSQAVGTFIPLTAQRVLESFWTSGFKRWDACFDRPYPFTMQIAVDVSQVSTL
ncbi:hypothetical protein T440DRAFT_488564 [Plenodomus tracheiphilus IPT5]|uniref:Zn(2)-C6 fungal-type domain-containing protein n=1 Tax=Plenodomus tracheiphilus IPT5 TaxID=1408161 RepID=A0A6A7BCS0_9PLEO|nr:hypothetical protein T440DRAFT_488564 [Plenodomus tracheiphilus IPT5]